MCSRCLSVLLACAIAATAREAKTLRVCADPDNLPFSNQAGQGFENKLAEMVAASMGAELAYTWLPERKSFVKKALGAGNCDVLTGIPSAMEDADATIPYYRSSYVFVSRAERHLGILSLFDERLARWRIGLNIVGNDYAPPSFALARRGITQNIFSFSLPGKGPCKIVDAVDQGIVDVAIVWGPVAGYFAKTARHALTIEPVFPPVFAGVPFVFDISMGVRNGDEDLKNKLNAILQSHASAIKDLLSQYGVPRVQ